MILAALFALLAAAAAYPVQDQFYSFSPPVGSGSGTSYSITGEGRITGIRVWERYANYISGIQLRYGSVWSEVAGQQYSSPLEMALFDGEAIVQVSGKYSHYVQSLVFTTNKGRSLLVGQPQGHSFNMYPDNKMAELRFISGRSHGSLTSIGTHWAVCPNATAPY